MFANILINFIFFIMKLKTTDVNYSAIIAKVDEVIPIEGADKIHTIVVLGNYIVTQKTIKEGDVGIYFPVESELSVDFMFNNNLYNNSDKNKDKEKKGYISDNGRLRFIKLRGQISEGLFLSLNSLSYIDDGSYNNMKIGDSFNIINHNNKEYPICKKYIVQQQQKNSNKMKTNNNVNNLVKEFVVDNQFRFHKETEQLYRNLNLIDMNDYISISYKLHGSSGISSKVLLKRKLSIFEKLLIKLKININQYEYGYIYSSGKPKSKLPKGIKNKFSNKKNSHYNDNIWMNAHNELEDGLDNGITLYYEIVGFTKSGSYIQKDYDYGCREPKKDGRYVYGEHFDIYVYRVTYTNDEGKVFEFNTNQMKQYCDRKNIKTIPILNEGKISDFVNVHNVEWKDEFINYIVKNYNGGDCCMCNNKVPREGVVIRFNYKEGFVAFKQKSKEFYEYETKILDGNISNIEDE